MGQFEDLNRELLAQSDQNNNEDKEYIEACKTKENKAQEKKTSRAWLNKTGYRGKAYYVTTNLFGD